MPHPTFYNLPHEKKEQIETILLDTFYQRHVSQVTVAEIVTAMGMSRGAFYKYFVDLEDAYRYSVATQARLIHQDILASIKASQNDFFEGIKNYLMTSASLAKTSPQWRGISLFILSGEGSANQRLELDLDSPLVTQWLELITLNGFSITSPEEALSFLYFSMSLVTTTLADFIVNDWSMEELLTDYNFKVTWLKQGLT